MSTAQWIETKVGGIPADNNEEEEYLPPWRYHHSFVKMNDQLAIVVGGNNTVDCTYEDTHLLNISEINDVEETPDQVKLRWEEPVPGKSPEISEHGACAVEGQLFTFGGKQNGQHIRELYILKQNPSEPFKWSRARKVEYAPSPRSGVTCTPVTNKIMLPPEDESESQEGEEVQLSYVIVFGGGAQTTAAFDEFHCFHAATLAWVDVNVFGDKPTARRDHSATCIGENTFIIFGGKGLRDTRSRNVERQDIDSSDDDDNWYSQPQYYGASTYVSLKSLHPLNDAYLVKAVPNAEDETKVKVYCHKITYKSALVPEPRFGHSAACVNGNLVIIGGDCGIDKGLKNDVWILNTKRMEWSQCSVQGIPPTPRFGHQIISVGSKIILWGGYFIGRNQNKLHILDVGKLGDGITDDAIQALMQDAIKDEETYENYGWESSGSSDS